MIIEATSLNHSFYLSLFTNNSQSWWAGKNLSYEKKFQTVSGFVAFVVGGGGHDEVEIFSPDGNCQHRLASFPLSPIRQPVLAYIDNQVLACGGVTNKDCFLYNPENDSWKVYSSADHKHDYQPGEVFEKKIYIADDSNPEVFDPATKIWSSWPAPSNPSGWCPCLLAWQDLFILIGGDSNVRGVQTFNHSSNEWNVLDSSSAPMDVFCSGCVVLPNDDVLVVGSENNDVSSAAIFNVRSNAWRQLSDTSIERGGTSLVTLGSRVFAIDGHGGNVVEEFNYETQTWSPVDAKLTVFRKGHQGVVSLPADMFQHREGGCTGVQ